MESFKFSDEVTGRAVDAVRRGTNGNRPLYEAAEEIAAEEDERRRESLKETGSVELDPELFPPDVFNPDGSRKKNNDGSAVLTEAEKRAYFELRDSRECF